MRSKIRDVFEMKDRRDEMRERWEMSSDGKIERDTDTRDMGAMRCELKK